MASVQKAATGDTVRVRGEPPAPPAPRRPDLSDRALLVLVAGVAVALLAWPVLQPRLPGPWQQPGTPVLQSLAIVGALLLLVPFAFALGKRSGASRVPNRLFILHVIASSLGVVLVFVHAAARLAGPPLFILACLVLLVLTGVVARVHVATRMAATFGTKSAPFEPPPPGVKERLRDILRRKHDLLRRLDPAAREALFSVTLRHWLRAPRLAFAYQRLVQREARLLGARASVAAIQAWWRPLHLALAWLFLAGLLAHVVVVTFFAGYVAGGREIYWWHLTDY